MKLKVFSFFLSAETTPELRRPAPCTLAELGATTAHVGAASNT